MEDIIMIKKWNEQTALSYLLSCGAENPRNKVILKDKGFKGLKACSAIDYLRNHCGYNILL
jgi:hypothetical protein